MDIKYKIWLLFNKLLSPYRFAQLKRIYFHLRHGHIPRGLNYANPQTFNEKINYLKIFRSQNTGSILADKIDVKEHVQKIVGQQYIIPTLGIYNNVNDIDWDKLPQSFVMKASHASGMNFICEDKSNYNFREIKPLMQKWMDTNYSKYGGEWQYNLQPRLLCETYLQNTTEDSLLDYRFFCFDGEPKYIVVDADTISKPSRNIYDLEWNLQPFRIYYPNILHEIKIPEKLDEMISIARQLSKNHPFIRIDLFNYKNHIYFGEITYHPAGGCQPIFPYHMDYELGKLINLKIA